MSSSLSTISISISMSSSSATGAHILVFPYPAHGHMLPLLDLTHQLALQGLTITILVTPKNLPILTPLLSAHPTIQTLVLPFPTDPSLPPGVEHVRFIGNRGNLPIMNSLSNLYDPIFQWFKSHNNPPVAILSDFFLSWTLRLAQNLGVPRIVFYSSGAFITCVVDHLCRHKRTVQSLPFFVFDDLPGSPSFAVEHLPPMVRYYRESDPEWESVRDAVLGNSSSWGCVFNTFDALEGEYLEHIEKKTGHPRVWGVGPLSLTGGSDLKERGGISDSGVLTWLDGCPDGSVVYVCFGSQKSLKSEQMEALGSGLERSGARFIWVVKAVTDQQVDDGYGFVLDGLEERVGERGKVIKGWAPQVSILSHRAVGAFLSHCGWNSVLEGIVGGAMIVAWPLEADQFVNAKLLVDDMGVAVRAWQGENAVPDPGELAQTIAESLSPNIPQKVKAKELRESALEAVKVGGSSSRGLVGLVEELSQLQLKRD